MQKNKQILLTVFILLLPGIGYAMMRGLVYVLPLSDNNIANALVYALLILFMGLVVPMWIVKLGIHVASMNNPRAEPDLMFKNIAKDKDQLARSQKKSQQNLSASHTK